MCLHSVVFLSHLLCLVMWMPRGPVPARWPVGFPRRPPLSITHSANRCLPVPHVACLVVCLVRLVSRSHPRWHRQPGVVSWAALRFDYSPPHSFFHLGSCLFVMFSPSPIASYPHRRRRRHHHHRYPIRVGRCRPSAWGSRRLSFLLLGADHRPPLLYTHLLSLVTHRCFSCESFPNPWYAISVFACVFYRGSLECSPWPIAHLFWGAPRSVSAPLRPLRPPSSIHIVPSILPSVGCFHVTSPTPMLLFVISFLPRRLPCLLLHRLHW